MVLSPAEHRCSCFQLVTAQDPVLLDVNRKQKDVLTPAELSLNPRGKRHTWSIPVSHFSLDPSFLQVLRGHRQAPGHQRPGHERLPRRAVAPARRGVQHAECTQRDLLLRQQVQRGGGCGQLCPPGRGGVPWSDGIPRAMVCPGVMVAPGPWCPLGHGVPWSDGVPWGDRAPLHVRGRADAALSCVGIPLLPPELFPILPIPGCSPAVAGAAPAPLFSSRSEGFGFGLTCSILPRRSES